VASATKGKETKKRHVVITDQETGVTQRGVVVGFYDHKGKVFEIVQIEKQVG